MRVALSLTQEQKRSDFFFFSTSPHIELYPDEGRDEGSLMQVTDLSSLEKGRHYFLASGNFVVVDSDADGTPTFMLDGSQEIALPDEVVDALRGEGDALQVYDAE